MKLGQVTTINSGYPFRGSIVESVEPDSIVVQMKDVSPENGVDWFGCVSATLTGKRDPQWLKPGDILFVARGSHNHAIYVDDHVFEQAFQAVAAPHFFIISIEGNDVLPAYLTWFLNQHICQAYFEKNAEGSFAKSIRRSVLEQTPIAIPTLKKQQAIVDLEHLLKQEKRLLEKIVCNRKQLLNGIANELLFNS